MGGEKRAVSDPVLLAGQRWLPDFCTPMALFPLLLLAELVALIAVLSPTASGGPVLARLGPACLFAFWVALLCGFFLCLLKTPLRRAGPARGGTAALFVVLAVAWGCASAAAWLSPLLGLTPMRGFGFELRVCGLSVLVAAAALRYGYVHEQWKAQVEAKARAELDALQARIRPHFLFNTLNAIAGLVRSAPERAEDAVLDLSDLLRAALKAGSTLLPVVEEIELAQRYLAIERLRLGERLEVQLQLDDLPAGLKLPPLCLQPLVENAVLHGVQLLPQGGCIRIGCELTPGMVRLWIRNPRPLQPTSLAAGNGMAVTNVRARLQAALGPRADLLLDAQPEAFEVTLLLPWP